MCRVWDTKCRHERHCNEACSTDRFASSVYIRSVANLQCVAATDQTCKQTCTARRPVQSIEKQSCCKPPHVDVQEDLRLTQPSRLNAHNPPAGRLTRVLTTLAQAARVYMPQIPDSIRTNHMRLFHIRGGQRYAYWPERALCQGWQAASLNYYMFRRRLSSLALPLACLCRQAAVIQFGEETRDLQQLEKTNFTPTVYRNFGSLAFPTEIRSCCGENVNAIHSLLSVCASCKTSS